MSWKYPQTATSEYVVLVLDEDNATIRRDVSLTTIGTNPTISIGESNLFVNGSVYATSVAIETWGRSNIVIGPNGIVKQYAPSDTLMAAISTSGNTNIDNRGTILSENSYAVRLDDDAVITNYGLISGKLSGIIASRGYTSTVFNHGTIEGEKYAFEVSPSSNFLSAKIFNFGAIKGDILFGDGADIYAGEDGYLNGTLYAGRGDDDIATGINDDIVYGGEGNDFLQGGGGLDKLYGGAGDDTIDGQSGADYMSGGAGDDLYYVDDTEDHIIEKNAEGIDTVISSVDFTLKGIYAEKIILVVDAGNIDATGNKFDNTIVGTEGSNIINGMKGNDILTGGDGRDTFVFSTRLSAANVDKITDFTAADDTIKLDNSVFLGLKEGALNATAFKDTSRFPGGVDADDRILYNSSRGEIYFDRDGSGTRYDPVKFAVVDPYTTLNHQDFIVI